MAWYRTARAAAGFLLLQLQVSIFPAAAAVTANSNASPAATITSQPPAGDLTSDAGSPTRVSVDVRSGDTVASILERQGVGTALTASAVSAIGQTFDPRRLRIGDHVILTFARRLDRPLDRDLVSIHLDTGSHDDLTVVRALDGSFTSSLSADAPTDPLRTLHFKRVDGVVEKSFEATLRLASVPSSVVDDLNAAITYDPELPRRLPAGTHFELLYSLPSDAARVKRPQLFSATFTIGKREHHLYRYDAKTIRKTVFVDERGKATTPFNPLRPLRITQISSPFGWRIHPVLNTPEFHKGIDFRAPMGTPVNATSAGRIVEAGWNGNYGLMIRLRHGANLETNYAHLQKLAPALKVGDDVKAGQIIGYVGSTGLSTGPHLYYEVYVNGAAVNPLLARPKMVITVESDELKKLVQEAHDIERVASR
jgi:murein DD-endopeptidase MepM/ murein hydrolase activator NlpD